MAAYDESVQGSELAVDAATQGLRLYRDKIQAFAESLNKCVTASHSDQLVANLCSEVVELSAEYRDKHLKEVVQFVTNLRDFMENYVGGMTVEDFEACIDDIIGDASEYAEQGRRVSQIHFELYERGLRMVDQVKAAGNARAAESIHERTRAETFRQQETLHRARQQSCAKGASGFSGTAKLAGCTAAGSVFGTAAAAAAAEGAGASAAVVGAAVGGAAAVVAVAATAGVVCLAGAGVAAVCSTYHSARADMSSVKSKEAEMKGEKADNAFKLTGCVAQCIMMFSEAMDQAGTFFSGVKNEIEVCAEKATAAKDAMLDPDCSKSAVKRHFNKMRSAAKDLIPMCREFLAVAPGIQRDLNMIAARSLDTELLMCP